MANTRFNYDECRTQKLLQEATGPGRYMLNTPGQGVGIPFVADPQIRLQGWGANLQKVENGHPIDIDSYLLGLGRPPARNCSNKEFKPRVVQQSYPEFTPSITDQTRATHPAWETKDLEQNHRGYLFENPQEHTETPFLNNLNTRVLEKMVYEVKK